jgi:ribosome maturation factor RimP
MKLKKFGGTEQRVYDLIAPVVTDLGYLVWDVRYEKEGANWYLRIFIDSETETIGIEDCVKVTEPVDALLEEADPISQSYILEVSSAGLEADLVRESHFDACIGCQVRARGFRPFADGSREIIGELKDWDKDGITLVKDGAELKFAFNMLTFVKLYFDFDETN